ncbi:MAG: hypothetical protein AAGF47_08295, partial [Planctomycetota bacterium]
SSRKILTGRLKGERRSKKRGESVEFADHRPYVAGDDLLLRRDWCVSLRISIFTLLLCVMLAGCATRSNPTGPEPPSPLSYAASPIYDSERLLTVLPESSRDWRVIFMRLRIHETIFRTGRDWVTIPPWMEGWRPFPLDEEPEFVRDEWDATYRPGIEQRYVSLCKTLELLEAFPQGTEMEDGVVISGDKFAVIALWASVVAGMVYEQAGPHVIPMGELLGRESLPEINFDRVLQLQDIVALAAVPGRRDQAKNAIDGLGLLWLRHLYPMLDPEDIEMRLHVRDRVFIECTLDAEISYGLIVRRNHDALRKLEKPWQDARWSTTRWAARRYLKIIDVLLEVAPGEALGDRGLRRIARKWANSTRPRSRSNGTIVY